MNNLMINNRTQDYSTIINIDTLVLDVTNPNIIEIALIYVTYAKTIEITGDTFIAVANLGKLNELGVFSVMDTIDSTELTDAGILHIINTKCYNCIEHQTSINSKQLDYSKLSVDGIIYLSGRYFGTDSWVGFVQTLTLLSKFELTVENYISLQFLERTNVGEYYEGLSTMSDEVFSVLSEVISNDISTPGHVLSREALLKMATCDLDDISPTERRLVLSKILPVFDQPVSTGIIGHFLMSNRHTDCNTKISEFFPNNTTSELIEYYNEWLDSLDIKTYNSHTRTVVDYVRTTGSPVSKKLGIFCNLSQNIIPPESEWDKDIYEELLSASLLKMCTPATREHILSVCGNLSEGSFDKRMIESDILLSTEEYSRCAQMNVFYKTSVRIGDILHSDLSTEQSILLIDRSYSIVDKFVYMVENLNLKDLDTINKLGFKNPTDVVINKGTLHDFVLSPLGTDTSISISHYVPYRVIHEFCNGIFKNLPVFTIKGKPLTEGTASISEYINAIQENLIGVQMYHTISSHFDTIEKFETFWKEAELKNKLKLIKLIFVENKHTKKLKIQLAKTDISAFLSGRFEDEYDILSSVL